MPYIYQSGEVVCEDTGTLCKGHLRTDGYTELHFGFGGDIETTTNIHILYCSMRGSPGSGGLPLSCDEVGQTAGHYPDCPKYLPFARFITNSENSLERAAPVPREEEPQEPRTSYVDADGNEVPLVEEWRPFRTTGWQASNHGRLKDTRGHISLGSALDDLGYGVTIGGTKYLVHQLVAECFLPPKPSPRHIPDHINFERWNNLVHNLRWFTRRQNTLHRRTWENSVGSRHLCVEVGVLGEEGTQRHPSLSGALRALNRSGGHIIKIGHASTCARARRSGRSTRCSVACSHCDLRFVFAYDPLPEPDERGNFVFLGKALLVELIREQRKRRDRLDEAVKRFGGGPAAYPAAREFLRREYGAEERAWNDSFRLRVREQNHPKGDEMWSWPRNGPEDLAMVEEWLQSQEEAG
jgi:hypothetical protein